MGGDKEKGPFLSISALMIILTTLGITIFTQSPFKSARPPVSELSEPAKVCARLWQDPYQAVLDHVKTFKLMTSARKVCKFSIYTSDSSSRCTPAGEQAPLEIRTRMKEGKVTVLGVMVSGNRFAEDTEQRIRYRYAVLSALRRLGFIPDDPEHINYVAVSKPSDPQTGITSLSSIMPYEWLGYTSGDTPGKDSVLLLWINDDLFKENGPIQSLACLAGWIGLPIDQTGKMGIALKIIGPAWSGTLREMLLEANDQDNVEKFKALKGVSIYSPFATADNSLLLEGIRKKQLREEEAGEAVAGMFSRHGIDFTRTIRTDRELVRILMEELERRGIDMSKGDSRILLVSEWETVYGRLLKDILKRTLIEKNIPDVELRVPQISYLRGIDGVLPGEKEERKDEKPDTKKDDTEKALKLEEATGRSQYDYLRRLTQESYRLSRETRDSIKAIGVMGTDFYDKFLVLQAFHERFPQAIFFTTDLDARFLHPDALKWTRNLVIASNFDLSLRYDDKRKLQGEIPPFRDNYQTSLFFSTLWAFSKDNYDNPLKELLRKKIARRIDDIVKPQLFEIGRYSAVKLSRDEDDDIYPKRNSATGVKNVLLSAVALFIILTALLYFISTTVNELIRRIVLGHWIKTVGGFALMAGSSILFYMFVATNPDEEPISIFEGVSTWPTEALRLLAAILAIVFIIRSRRKLIDNCKEINRSFGLFQPGNDALYLPGERGKSIFSRIYPLCREWSNFTFHWHMEDKGNTMDELWREYLRRDSVDHRLLRLFPAVALYVFLCFCIIHLFGPPVSPMRGELSRLIDKIVIFATVISFTALVFYVFDVIRNCRRFIDIASERIRECEWSDDLIGKVMKENVIRRGEEMKEWVLIQLIARRTDEVGKLIFYPFIVWFVMFISRIRVIDNWQTPVGLAIVLTMSALIAWSCAFLLRRSAEKARGESILRLKEQLASLMFHEKADEEKIRRIEFVIKEVNEIRSGAFAPFMQHPLVQALFVPFGGVGGVYLLEFLTKMNL
jgi:hypothetical protein